MKHKRIWFKNRIGEEVWQEIPFNSFKQFLSTHPDYVHLHSPILQRIQVTKQNMESLYLSQVEKHYKYYDL